MLGLFIMALLSFMVATTCLVMCTIMMFQGLPDEQREKWTKVFKIFKKRRTKMTKSQKKKIRECYEEKKPRREEHLQMQMANPSRTFVDRKKEASKRACKVKAYEF